MCLYGIELEHGHRVELRIVKAAVQIESSNDMRRTDKCPPPRTSA